MAGRIATLSGWGQAHNALAGIAPEALHIDYARHHSVSAALLEIAAQAKDCDVIIGWSLGGQLLMRAVGTGMLKPRYLVLIATPYQFVSSPKNPTKKNLGMKRDLYDKFRDNYAKNPKRTLHKAWELIHKDDSHASEVRAQMERQDKESIMQKDWLQWLDNLDGFSCDDLPLADFPPTLLLHGGKDAVVGVAQSDYFSTALPHAALIQFPGCGHAPHWHGPAAVKQAIGAFAHV